MNVSIDSSKIEDTFRMFRQPCHREQAADVLSAVAGEDTDSYSVEECYAELSKLIGGSDIISVEYTNGRNTTFDYKYSPDNKDIKGLIKELSEYEFMANVPKDRCDLFGAKSVYVFRSTEQGISIKIKIK